MTDQNRRKAKRYLTLPGTVAELRLSIGEDQSQPQEVDVVHVWDISEIGCAVDTNSQDLRKGAQGALTLTSSDDRIKPLKIESTRVVRTWPFGAAMKFKQLGSIKEWGMRREAIRRPRRSFSS